MAYAPTTWVEKATKVGPTNLNKLELGLQAAALVADNALPTPAGSNGQFLKRVGGVWVPTSFAATDIPNYPTDATKVLKGDGTWTLPPGYEYAYAEKTSATTTTQATPSSSVDIIATLAAVTFDGATKVKVEAFVPEVFNSVATNYNSLLLFEDGVIRATIGRIQNAGTTQGDSCKAEFEFTPASGSRTYSLRVAVGGGTGTFSGGAGTGGGFVPAFLKLTKA